MDRAAAAALLARAPVIHLATTTPEGAPLTRTVRGILLGDGISFVTAPAGEIAETPGRAAIVSAEEIVASTPGDLLYRRVEVHGVLERGDGNGNGNGNGNRNGNGVMVLRVSLERLDGKAKLAQNRTPEERARLMEQLWARGQPGDLTAIELLREANPGTPLPAFLRGPAGTTLAASLTARDAPAAAAMLDGAYWNQGVSVAEIALAQLGSSVWVGARDAGGALVATARAISDRCKSAWIYDVMVAPGLRGSGLGAALMRLLLDHPEVRGVRRVYLNTRDAQGFYEKLGFGDKAATEGTEAASTTMVLHRTG